MKFKSVSKQTDVEFLTEMKSHVETILGELKKRFPPETSSFVHTNLQQQLQQAASMFDQELRNIKIDAEMAAKKAQETLSNG